jgi:hypothetical protein
MGSDIRFDDLARKLRAFGVAVNDSTGSGHVNLTRDFQGISLPYTFPKSGGHHVKHMYIKKIRKARKLMPEDGVSDRDWERA